MAIFVAAAALAILLPTALNVPHSGPSTLAEFAPVPGQGSAGGDVVDLGGAAGSGPGVGDGVPGAGPEMGEIQRPAQRRPSLKRCVGDPPRQTEDPLSPPCVAFFEGDNFGATTKGVTKDEVAVVLYFEVNNNDPRVRRFLDCDQPPAADDPAGVHACRAYARFFNDRYQTYNRHVKVWAYLAPATSTPYESVATQIDTEKRPFGLMVVSTSDGEVLGPITARKRIVTAMYEAVRRGVYSEVSPYLISFLPDLDDMGVISAGYVCQKLKDRIARFAGPTESSRQRKFGFFSPNVEMTIQGPMTREMKDRCDLHVTHSATNNNMTTQFAQMRSDGVTTVIAIGAASLQVLAQGTATQQGWFPEWFVPGDRSMRGIDTNFWGRTMTQAQWEHAYGITFDYRRESISNQVWYRAYREGCPSCSDPTSADIAYIYDTFTMLFWGIQAAGPRLTPESLDRGMHAIPQRGSADPYKPAAYFGAGNYSFVKDAMAIWWDPSGAAPDDGAPGCYRLPHDGRRFRSGEWGRGDQDVRTPGPCQGSAGRT